MVIRKILFGLIVSFVLSACGHAPNYPAYNNFQAYSPNAYSQNQNAYSGYPNTTNNGAGFFSGNTGAQDTSYQAGSESGFTTYLPDGTSPSPVAPQATSAPSLIEPSVQGRGKLNILTYNVWGLPGPLGTQRKERFSRLAESFSGYDVITLQETFSNDIEVLRATVTHMFPYQHRHNNKGIVRIGSGLFTLSKYPIIKTEFRQFKKCTVADCMAKKGVLMTRVEHPTLGPVDIYTTHFQADSKASAKRIRMTEDNLVLQEFVHQMNSPYPVIITGDFNFLPKKDEYKDLLRRMPLIDIFDVLYPDDPGFTSHPENPYKKSDATPKRLDYIFALQSDLYKITPLDVKVGHDRPVDGFVLSDHYSVSAQLDIQILKTIQE